MRGSRASFPTQYGDKFECNSHWRFSLYRGYNGRCKSDRPSQAITVNDRLIGKRFCSMSSLCRKMNKRETFPSWRGLQSYPSKQMQCLSYATGPCCGLATAGNKEPRGHSITTPPIGMGRRIGRKRHNSWAGIRTVTEQQRKRRVTTIILI